MAEFTIKEILNTTKGRVVNYKDKKITGISIDSRSLKPGNLYIALLGNNYDGHDFVEKAIINGAGGAIVSHDINNINDVPIIYVKNTLKAFQNLTNYYRKRFNIPIIAVTGSNGKTTTKEMIATVLSEEFFVLKSEANFNNEIGLPLTLLKIKEYHKAAVLEMGMRSLGEIHELTKIAIPTIGIITNISETHLELLGSIKNIATAKEELIYGLKENNIAILNIDNSYVYEIAKKHNIQLLTFGIKEKANIRATNIKFLENGISFVCISPIGKFPIFLPVFGQHNIYNALAAIATGISLSLKIEKIITGIKKFIPEKMRFYVEKFYDYIFINDTYNASPSSMTAAINTLKNIAKQRKICILGDMHELGEQAKNAHENLGVELKKANVDVVITVGELAKYIALKAKEQKFTKVIICFDHLSAYIALKKNIKPGDTILVKGSRGMQMEKVIELFKYNF